MRAQRSRSTHGWGRRPPFHFLLYAVPGLPYGRVFALVGVGLALTYKTSGVFNLAFAAQAYLSASVYYKTVSGHHWNRLLAAVVSVLFVGVALGWLLDRLLFRHIRPGAALDDGHDRGAAERAHDHRPPSDRGPPGRRPRADGR